MQRREEGRECGPVFSIRGGQRMSVSVLHARDLNLRSRETSKLGW